MPTTAKQSELGNFLKSCRSRLTPRDAGLPLTPGPRRVSGLRREEVAALASISTDYYTRIEQGRIQASPHVIEDLARVLHLDDDQRRYLFRLADIPTDSPSPTHHTVTVQLQRLLDDLDSIPAVVLGRFMDVLAWNRLAGAMVTDFGKIPLYHRNYVRIMFTDPAMRDLYDDWEAAAQTAVAQLRMQAAKYPDDPRLMSLVSELSMRDTHFAQWWAARDVATLFTGTKILTHPRVGALTLDWDTLVEAHDTDQRLVIWTAADPSTQQALRSL